MLNKEQRVELLKTLDAKRGEFIDKVKEGKLPEDLMTILCFGSAAYELHMLQILGFSLEELGLDNLQPLEEAIAAAEAKAKAAQPA